MPNRADNPNDENSAGAKAAAAEASRESRWQFSIRGVLLLTLIAAGVCALIAPSIRDWSAENAKAALLHLAIIAVPSAIVVWLNFTQERSSRSAAGRLIATLHWPGARDRAVLLWAATVGMFLLMLLVVFVQTENSSDGGLCVAVMLSLGALIVFPPTIFYALTGIVPGEIEFCEYGMIQSGKRFLPISRITGWSIERKILTLTLDAHEATSPDYGPWVFQAEVPPETEEQIIALLEHWCPQEPDVIGQDAGEQT